jgi:N-methylhydantoinase A
VIVPQLASVWSAFGAATADIRRERARTLGVTLPTELQHVEKVAAELLAEVESDLAADDVAPTDRSYQLEADMKFARQVWELTIALPLPPLHADDMTAVVDEFRAQYGRQYGTGSIAPGAPVELVNLRVIGTGATPKPTVGARAHAASSFAASNTLRGVRIHRGDGTTESVPVYTMDALRPGDRVSGPCLIDGSDTTVWMPPDTDLSVASDGKLDIDIH